MIMFFLPWWTYVLIGTVAFTCSFAAVWLAGIAFDRETPDDDGPYPCGEYLGMDEEGADDWCWQVAGHDCEHVGMRQDWSGVLESTDCACHDAQDFSVLRQTDAAGNVVIDENPGYLPDSAPLPDLPQRLSKVPEQGAAIQGSGYTPAQLLGQTEHNDPWPMCDRRSVDGVCDMSPGHPGPHEYV